MIPHPDDCNWIDPAVKAYTDEDLAVLSVLAFAIHQLDATGKPPAPVRDTYASRLLAVAA